MKVLVTGVKGQLGFDVVKRLKALNIECKGVDIEDFDLTDEAAVRKGICDYNPDAVVHCAAFTAVDKAEDARDICYNVNVSGVRNVALACKETDAKMVYISTDYVFDGQGINFFNPEDKKDPINYYGETKSLGEDEVTKLLEKYFIIRISWVFGINGGNFVKTMIRLGKERDELNVVCDQIGSPTYTKDLAVLIADMIQTDKYGIYHATNEGVCSWAEFAKQIMLDAGLDTKINFITSDKYPAKAKRPFNSRMSKNKLDENGFSRLPGWHDALKRYIDELRDNEQI